MSARAAIAAWILAAGVVAAGVVAGCQKRSQEPPAPVEPMSAEEAARGKAACEAYVAKMCACAAQHPDSAILRERCELAPAKLSALDMLLRANHQSGTDDRDRLLTHDKARKLIAACIRERNQLETQACTPPAVTP